MIRKIIFFSLVQILSFVTVNAQNLVPNPGFELNTGCNEWSETQNLNSGLDYAIKNLLNWRRFKTVDYHVQPNNCDGMKKFGSNPIVYLSGGSSHSSNVPRNGDGMVGLSFSNANYNREYLMVELTQPLQYNRRYAIEFYVRSIRNFPGADYFLNNIGAAVVSGDASAKPQLAGPFGIDQVLNYNVVASSGNNPIEYDWVRVYGEFWATELDCGEQADHSWLVIGSFHSQIPDFQFSLKPGLHPGPDHADYIFIDDVSLTVLEDICVEKTCNDHATLSSGAFIPPFVSANNTVTVQNSTMNPGQSLLTQAGNSICFKPNVCVPAGASLCTKLEPCSTNAANVGGIRPDIQAEGCGFRLTPCICGGDNTGAIYEWSHGYGGSTSIWVNPLFPTTYQVKVVKDGKTYYGQYYVLPSLAPFISVSSNGCDDILQVSMCSQAGFSYSWTANGVPISNSISISDPRYTDVLYEVTITNNITNESTTLTYYSPPVFNCCYPQHSDVQEIAEINVDCGVNHCTTEFRANDVFNDFPGMTWNWSSSTPGISFLNPGSITNSQMCIDFGVYTGGPGPFDIILTANHPCGYSRTYTKTVYLSGSNCRLGQANSESLTLKIYPNPSQGVFNVESGGGDYKVLNTQAVVVAQGSSEPGFEVLDLSQLHSGVYMFILQSKSELETRRIVIER